MKKVLGVLSILFVFMVGACFGEASKEENVPLKDRVVVKIVRNDAVFFASGAMYAIQSGGIALPDSLLYFAAKDFTTNKDFLVRKAEKAELIVDTSEQKVVKVTFLLGNEKIESDIDPNYRLEITAEVRKGYQLMALTSKFIYLGNGAHKVGINWGLCSSSDKDPFKYYTLPDKSGKELTYRLEAASKFKKNKIGYAKWLYLHNGKGSGVVLICPAMLGKGEDFIFVNTVPPTKTLKKGESADVFMVFLPVKNNFKRIPKMYEDIKNMKWKES